MAPTFLDIASVPIPPHMDGKSILPLIINRHRSIKYKWPDTFLIESSGRRETAEQLSQQRAKADAAKYSQLLNSNNNRLELNFSENKTTEELKVREHDSSEHDENDDDELGEDEDEESDPEVELQRDQPKKTKKRRHRESKCMKFHIKKSHKIKSHRLFTLSKHS